MVINTHIVGCRGRKEVSRLTSSAVIQGTAPAASQLRRTVPLVPRAWPRRAGGALESTGMSYLVSHDPRISDVVRRLFDDLARRRPDRRPYVSASARRPRRARDRARRGGRDRRPGHPRRRPADPDQGRDSPRRRREGARRTVAHSHQLPPGRARLRALRARGADQRRGRRLTGPGDARQRRTADCGADDRRAPRPRITVSIETGGE